LAGRENSNEDYNLRFMNTRRKRKKVYIIWVIISVLAVVSMIGFLFAPLLIRY